ncbi:hypothetical protein NE619_11895 [Anaerovorax odorimutans]|uniref:Uncharacterized protein n=1 Tax=Anaerovorax odorimutans TaxID=109327 RepID=A0ABT1RQF8_9FIRM|nr:hypothetical protein [Anaerovorax odorimutans]MCQ4637428.1 hypothetical protein [Anaerovorax odorimutans]
MSKLQNIAVTIVLTVSVVLIVCMKTAGLYLGLAAVLPYLFVFLCVWLLLSVNMLRRSMDNLQAVPTDKRAEIFAALLQRTFAAEFFIKTEDLTDAYNHAIHLPQVSYQTKKKLYDAFDRRHIFVPYPAYGGKKGKK